MQTFTNALIFETTKQKEMDILKSLDTLLQAMVTYSGVSRKSRGL